MSEQIAEQIDTLENLIGALQLPLKAEMHVDQLRGAQMNNEEEIIIWLKKIHEELYALNSRLGEMSTEAKETDNGGRTWRTVGAALRTTK